MLRKYLLATVLGIGVGSCAAYKLDGKENDLMYDLVYTRSQTNPPQCHPDLQNLINNPSNANYLLEHLPQTFYMGMTESTNDVFRSRATICMQPKKTMIKGWSKYTINTVVICDKRLSDFLDEAQWDLVAASLPPESLFVWVSPTRIKYERNERREK